MEPDKSSIPILLVDDSCDDVELIEVTLKKKRIYNPVYVARDGTEAMSTLHCPFFQQAS